MKLYVAAILVAALAIVAPSAASAQTPTTVQ